MPALIILSIFSLLIFLFLSALLYHTINSLEKVASVKNKSKKISIVVAAKDEEKNIINLLDSFLNLDYPKDKFEIIIIDDNSVDNTIAILESYSEKIPNLKIISAGEKKFPAKKGALETGINAAAFDYIVLTDADCKVPQYWLQYFSNKFDTGADFIFGNVIYTNKKNSFAGFIQQFENFRSKLLYFSAAKLNFPYSAAGANLGFKKEAFFNLKGYSQISKSLSGSDDLLIQMAYRHNLKVDFIIEEDATVETESISNFNSLLKTKARHTSASYYYSIKAKLFLTLWHLPNLISFLSILLIPINQIFILPFLIKIIIDSLFSMQFCKMFGYRFNNFQSVIFQIIYEVMIIINFFNGFRFLKRWK